MKPSIVIAGLDQTFLDEIFQGLTGETKTLDNNPIEWTIDTKYYTADVHLCPVKTKMLVEESVANSAEMLILLIDPIQINNRTKLDSWLPFFSVLNECEAKLLVARSVDAITNTIPKTDLKQWCTEHGYELLELDKSTTSETDDDDDDDDDENTHLSQDVYGVPRLMQILHVHQWPNMNLKDRREINRNLVKQLQEKLNFDTNHFNNEEQQDEQNEQFDSSSTTNNHHDKDAFGMENIFEQMKKYKEEADQLTGDERKQYAEKVILSLWKNIGDDEDETDEENHE
ncbi:hypothetical protein I4U23_008820 [Adineta vaga]|nr:hypothetical protein I4U23_008820 [Adineta vaga]